MGSDDKRCRVCGDELACFDYGNGSVWTCDTHGVRDWHFGDQGATWTLPSAASSLAARAPKGPGLA